MAGPWSGIADSTVDNGQYQWAVPESVNSNQCYIRYTAVALGDTSVSITPAAFAIATGTGVDDASLCRVGLNTGLEVFPSIGQQEFAIRLNVNTYDKRHLSIHDANGNLLRDLLTVYGAGRFLIPWDRRDKNGRPVPAGIYFVTLSGSTDRMSQKIVVID